MRYMDTAEMGGNMNPAGADVAITDTILLALATRPVPDRATTGQAATTAALGRTGQRQDDADTRARRARLVFAAWLTAAVAAVTVAAWPATRSRNRRSSQTSKGARTGIIPHEIINAQAVRPRPLVRAALFARWACSAWSRRSSPHGPALC